MLGWKMFVQTTNMLFAALRRSATTEPVWFFIERDQRRGERNPRAGGHQVERLPSEYHQIVARLAEGKHRTTWSGGSWAKNGLGSK
jgi:hypothetical protein